MDLALVKEESAAAELEEESRGRGGGSLVDLWLWSVMLFRCGKLALEL